MRTALFGRLRVDPRALLLVVAALALYAATAAFSFVWDDFFVVPDAQRIGRQHGPAGFFAAEYRTEPASTGYYRPLVLLSLWLNGPDRGQPDAAAYHLFNAALHAANALLLYLVLVAAGMPRAGAFCGALLWALHPVHTEAVAPVTGRVDLLPAFFVLLATWAWLKDRARPGWAPLAAGGAAFLAAGLSKETGLMLPAALLAWDLLDPPTGPGAARAYAEGALAGWWRRNRRWLAAWGIALSTALALRLAVARVGWGSAADPAPPLAADPVAAAGLLLLHSAKLLSLPWPQNSLYSPLLLAVGWWTVAGALLTAGALAVTSAFSRRRVGLVAFAWAAAFLFPVSGIVGMGSVAFAERYLYLPAMGVCAAAGALLGEAMARGGRWRAGATALAAALALALAGLTAARLPVWRDEVSLFTDMARGNPGSTVARNNLGAALENAGRLDEAVAQYRRAVELYPGNRTAVDNLERALRKAASMGRIGGR